MPDALRLLTAYEIVRMIMEMIYHIGDGISISAHIVFERANDP